MKGYGSTVYSKIYSLLVSKEGGGIRGKVKRRMGRHMSLERGIPTKCIIR